jgi:hypothetical protein
MEDYSTRASRRSTGLSAMIPSASRWEQVAIATRYSGTEQSERAPESPPRSTKIMVARKLHL